MRGQQKDSVTPRRDCLAGGRWLAPVPKSGDRAIQMTNALVTLSGGNLDEPFSGTFFVTTNTTFALISGSVSENYPNSLRAGITASGLISEGMIAPSIFRRPMLRASLRNASNNPAS